MRYFSLLLLTVILLSDAAVNPLCAQKKLVIIGSSTSACAEVNSVTECYTGRLRAYYDMQAPEDTLVENDLALGGTNCYNGMPSSYVSPYAAPYQPITDRNITAALNRNPDVIIVNYPTNDYNTLRIDSIMYCLRTIRDSANIKGVPCFVTTTQPRTAFSAPDREKLRELKDSILLEMGFFAIDFWTDLADPADNTLLPAYRVLVDNIHMNAAGHNILLQRVLAKNVFLATLPATFLNFNAAYRNNDNIISWATAKETDVANYDIQRSADGINFSKIGEVPAYNGTGNHQYMYTDNQPVKEWNYYKIVIIDRDGKKHASPVMKVHINTGKLTLLKAFATSASQVLVSLQNNEPQMAQVKILDNFGRLLSTVSRKIETGSTNLYLTTPALAAGIYHVQLVAAKGATLSASFIKN
ncbi:MAG: SGNH/GDSL hydrolase family protein [Chitinophagaceae bacterium]